MDIDLLNETFDQLTSFRYKTGSRTKLLFLKVVIYVHDRRVA